MDPLTLGRNDTLNLTEQDGETCVLETFDATEQIRMLAQYDSRSSASALAPCSPPAPSSSQSPSFAPSPEGESDFMREQREALERIERNRMRMIEQEQRNSEASSYPSSSSLAPSLSSLGITDEADGDEFIRRQREMMERLERERTTTLTAAAACECGGPGPGGRRRRSLEATSSALDRPSRRSSNDLLVPEEPTATSRRDTDAPFAKPSAKPNRGHGAGGGGGGDLLEQQASIWEEIQRRRERAFPHEDDKDRREDHRDFNEGHREDRRGSSRVVQVSPDHRFRLVDRRSHVLRTEGDRLVVACFECRESYYVSMRCKILYCPDCGALTPTSMEAVAA